MLRYAISEGRSALGSTSSTPTERLENPAQTAWNKPSQKPAGNACHSERSEEPPYFALPPTPSRTRLLAHAASVAAQNIDFFLLREPTLPAGQLATLAREILPLLANSPTRLLLRSRPDVAIAAHAHGVHLPSTPGQLTPTQIRTLYASANRPTPTISLSCHTEEDIRRARETNPDLIIFGPIFGKTIANQLITPPAGLEALRQACTLADPIPILALGGITESNTASCLEAGAAGIAAIRLFSFHGNPDGGPRPDGFTA